MCEMFPLPGNLTFTDLEWGYVWEAITQASNPVACSLEPPLGTVTRMCIPPWSTCQACVLSKRVLFLYCALAS